MRRPLIVTVACRRCGKLIASGTRYAETPLYRELGQMCADCTTPDETHRLNIETGGLIMMRIKGVTP